MSDATTIAHDVPEGWYTDPENARMQRYWDGSDWSDHVRYSDAASMPKASWDNQPNFEPEHPVASLSDHQAVLAYIAQPSLTAQPGIAASSAPSAFDAPAVPQLPAVDDEPAFASQPMFAEPAFVAPPTFAERPAFAVQPASLTKRDFASTAAFEGGGIAYVPLRHYYLPPAARPESWNPKAFSPSTAAIWLLALTPVLWTALQLANSAFAPAGAAPMISLIVSVAVLAIMLLCAVADRRTLQGRSMATPSIGWFFVGVVPYFTARWFVLRREGTRYIAPAVTFITLLVASAVLWVTLLGAMPLI